MVGNYCLEKRNPLRFQPAIRQQAPLQSIEQIVYVSTNSWPIVLSKYAKLTGL